MDTLAVKVEVTSTANLLIALLSQLGDRDAKSSKATSNRVFPAKVEVVATIRPSQGSLSPRHCHLDASGGAIPSAP